VGYWQHSHAARLHAHLASWRENHNNNLNYVAGGEALQVTTTAATRAAEEAATGKWLEEFESGRPLRALVPRMDQGVFGAWELPEEAAGQASGVSTNRKLLQYLCQLDKSLRGMSTRYNVPCSQVKELPCRL
jgi:hypothetical protein